MSEELHLLRQLAAQIRLNEQAVLMDVQPDHCGCARGQVRYVYRNPASALVAQMLKEHALGNYTATSP